MKIPQLIHNIFSLLPSFPNFLMRRILSCAHTRIFTTIPSIPALCWNGKKTLIIREKRSSFSELFIYSFFPLQKERIRNSHLFLLSFNSVSRLAWNRTTLSPSTKKKYYRIFPWFCFFSGEIIEKGWKSLSQKKRRSKKVFIISKLFLVSQ